MSKAQAPTPLITSLASAVSSAAHLCVGKFVDWTVVSTLVINPPLFPQDDQDLRRQRRQIVTDGSCRTATVTRPVSAVGAAASRRTSAGSSHSALNVSARRGDGRSEWPRVAR